MFSFGAQLSDMRHKVWHRPNDYSNAYQVALFQVSLKYFNTFS